jgi:hypothetical protein
MLFFIAFLILVAAFVGLEIHFRHEEFVADAGSVKQKLEAVLADVDAGAKAKLAEAIAVLDKHVTK